MIFSLSLIALFVGVSIYFYFRAESLYRQVLMLKKDVATVKKESKAMVDSIALVAEKNAEFAQLRFKKLQDKQGDNEDLALLAPLFNNYATIFRESMRGKGQLAKAAKKCCDNYKQGSYQSLAKYISAQDNHIKRMWNGNNIGGFMSFIEAILLELEKKQTTTEAA